MRLISLNDTELSFCMRVAKEREHFALGYALERGWTPKFKGQDIEMGTAEGDKFIAEEEEIHRVGVTGELAFCKHFDINYPNRMRRAFYNYATNDVEWTGDTKDADVGENIEVRTIGSGIGILNVKENDNPSFNVVGLRKLNAESSLFRILGFYPVRGAQDRADWKASPPYKGYCVPIEMLHPIELLPFEGQTLAEYECERRDALLWGEKVVPLHFLHVRPPRTRIHRRRVLR